jgi:hypothetical protein
LANGTQILAAALEELLTAFGRGIGQAQLELGRSAIQLQRDIDADPELSQHGITATWYQIPSAEMEFKVALTIQSDSGTGVPAPGGATLPRVRGLLVHPLNAAYQNQFRFDASAASTIRLTVLPVPAQTTEALDRPPLLTPSQALAAADALLARDAAGQVRTDTRVVANFQAASRTWYVLQYTQVGGTTTTVTMIEVDDSTRQARKR